MIPEKKCPSCGFQSTGGQYPYLVHFEPLYLAIWEIVAPAAPTIADNDMVLLELPYSLQFNDHVNAICLPREEDEQKFKTDHKCVVAGWGKKHHTDEGTYLPQEGLFGF